MTVFRKIIHHKGLITLATVLILYTLSGFFMAPYLVSRFAPQIVGEKLHRELRLGPVKINPFLFSFQADDVGLHEPDGTLVAGFRQCFVDLELSSLFRWALVFKTIRLDGLRVNVMIDREGRLNLARLLPESPETDPSGKPMAQETAGTNPPGLILKHVQITDGEIDLTDQRPSVPAQVVIQPLDIELHDITTFPEGKGSCRLAATTREKESFQWTGEMMLNPFRSSGRVGFSDIKLSTVWQFLRDRLALDKPEGRFSLDTAYTADLGQPEASVRLDDFNFVLAALAVQLSGDKSPLLELSRLDLKAPLVDLTRGIVDVERILFEGGKTELVFDENGHLNWSGFIAASPTGAPASATVASKPDGDGSRGKKDTPWKVEVSGVELRDIRFDYRDRSRTRLLDAGVSDIDGTFNFSLASDSAGTDFQVRDATFGLNDIRIGNPERSTPEILIENWLVRGGRFDFGRNTLAVEGVTVHDGAIDIRREEDGGLNIVELFVPGDTAAEKTPEPSGKIEGSPFHYLVKEAEFSNIGLTFSDQTVKTDGVMLHLDNLHLVAADIDGKSQMPVDLSFDVREGGHAALRGRIDPLGPFVQADMDIASISLPSFEPYLTSLAALEVVSGTLSTRGRFAYGEKEARPKLAYEGNFDVADLQIMETGSEKTLLGWRHFMTSDLTFGLQPDRLEVKALELSGLDGRFIVHEDGSLNLTHVFKGKTDDPGGNEPQAPAEKTGAMFPIYVHKLQVKEGSLFFADYSLRPQFATKIHQLEGTLIGMSSERGARTQVQIDGRVDEYGMSKINGEINFFEPAAYTDISVLFRNLEMTRLTPYSGKFVGRRIDSGKLSLDLKYFIENGKLKGDNQITVERIELGRKIDSPDAVSLPLNLAIAILEDADGVIDLGLPVSGDLADPKFSYGALIWKAFTNLITKIATAPFRALGALFGGDSETLDAVMFESGSAGLLPPELEKLANLAGALEKRPNLKLIVQGKYSREKDGEALKALQVRQHLARQQGLEVVPGRDSDLLDFGNPDVRSALETVFTQRFGPEALDGIMTAAAKSPAGDKKPENAAGGGVKIDDPAGPWKILYQRMVDEESLAETALMELGAARAQAILSELQGPGGILPDRMALKQPEALKPGIAPQAALTLDVLQAERVKSP